MSFLSFYSWLTPVWKEEPVVREPLSWKRWVAITTVWLGGVVGLLGVMSSFGFGGLVIFPACYGTFHMVKRMHTVIKITFNRIRSPLDDSGLWNWFRQTFTYGEAAAIVILIFGMVNMIFVWLKKKRNSSVKEALISRYRERKLLAALDFVWVVLGVSLLPIKGYKIMQSTWRKFHTWSGMLLSALNAINLIASFGKFAKDETVSKVAMVTRRAQRIIEDDDEAEQKDTSGGSTVGNCAHGIYGGCSVCIEQMLDLPEMPEGIPVNTEVKGKSLFAKILVSLGLQGIAKELRSSFQRLWEYIKGNPIKILAAMIIFIALFYVAVRYLAVGDKPRKEGGKSKGKGKGKNKGKSYGSYKDHKKSKNHIPSDPDPGSFATPDEARQWYADKAQDISSFKEDDDVVLPKAKDVWQNEMRAALWFEDRVTGNHRYSSPDDITYDIIQNASKAGLTADDIWDELENPQSGWAMREGVKVPTTKAAIAMEYLKLKEKFDAFAADTNSAVAANMKAEQERCSQEVAMKKELAELFTKYKCMNEGVISSCMKALFSMPPPGAGCCHASDCPEVTLRGTANPNLVCNVKCGGQHCTHWKECNPPVPTSSISVPENAMNKQEKKMKKAVDKQKKNVKCNFTQCREIGHSINDCPKFNAWAKTQNCKKFPSCPYGAACKFKHSSISITSTMLPSSNSNVKEAAIPDSKEAFLAKVVNALYGQEERLLSGAQFHPRKAEPSLGWAFAKVSADTESGMTCVKIANKLFVCLHILDNVKDGAITFMFRAQGQIVSVSLQKTGAMLAGDDLICFNCPVELVSVPSLSVSPPTKGQKFVYVGYGSKADFIAGNIVTSEGLITDVLPDGSTTYINSTTFGNCTGVNLNSDGKAISLHQRGGPVNSGIALTKAWLEKICGSKGLEFMSATTSAF